MRFGDNSMPGVGYTPVGRLARLAVRVRWEIWLSWQFIKNNTLTTIVPLTVFALALSLNVRNDVTPTLLHVSISFVYFYLFIYTFDLNSQIFGVEEDRANKPDRPIPTGIVTLVQAKRRAMVVSLAFVLLSIAIDAVPYALAWLMLVLLYSYTAWSCQWLLKCLLVSLGTQTQLPVVAGIVGLHSAALWTWGVGIFVLMTMLIGVQDFRDVDGDRRVGRRTLPIVFGETRARILIVISYVLSIAVAHCTIFAQAREGAYRTMATGFELVGAAMLLTVAYRLIYVRRTRQQDHTSYRIMECWYVLACASIVCVPV
ncbi:UbiA family prenyltransferase [Burkholderia gladioli]|uniref:UbiA family prenyltransferase n=1 Tax=Burkholderia gladioli TaxID=28095 RepID=UPI000F53BA4D|nr:UbiA family prenyltransferase [Burkholderia gladioli]